MLPGQAMQRRFTEYYLSLHVKNGGNHEYQGQMLYILIAQQTLPSAH